LFFSMSALAGEFVVHQGAADKFDWQDDWRKREQRWWESGGRARQVTNSFIVWRAGGACPNGRKRPVLWAVHRSGAK